MLATQVLHDISIETIPGNLISPDAIGALVVDNNRYEIKIGENKIGRDPTVCSIVINNITISKVHAVIECEGKDDTFIYDSGSTNQTKLGKTNLKPNIRYKLEDKSIITLGNVITQFIINSEYSFTQTEFPNLTSPFKLSFDDFNDIFNASTQVSPNERIHKKPTEIFENAHDLKIPELISCTEQNNSYLEISQSVFDQVTQFQFNEESKESGNHKYDCIEDSSIFSMITQGQLSQPPSLNLIDEVIEKKLLPNYDKVKDPEEMKLLLNDGEDNELCKFMSLHSPNGNVSNGFKNEKSKAKIVPEIYSSNIFNEPTQIVQRKEYMEKDIEDLKEALEKSTDLDEDIFINSQSIDDKETVIHKENNSSDKIFSNDKEKISSNVFSSLKKITQDCKYVFKSNNDSSEQYKFFVNKIEKKQEPEYLIIDETSDDNTELDFEVTLAGLSQNLRDDDFIETQPLINSSTQLTTLKKIPGNPKFEKKLKNVSDGKDCCVNKIEGGTNEKNNSSTLKFEYSVTENCVDESESDSEIVLDSPVLTNFKNCPFSEISMKEKISSTKSKNSNDLHQNNQFFPLEENNDSDSSYVFEFERENKVEQINYTSKAKVTATIKNLTLLSENLTDSDLTDCEGIQTVNDLKTKSFNQKFEENPVFNETQVFSQELFIDITDKCKNPNEKCTVEEESPKFEIENEWLDDNFSHSLSQLSLEIPNTQDIGRTHDKDSKEKLKNNTVSLESKTEKTEEKTNLLASLKLQVSTAEVNSDFVKNQNISLLEEENSNIKNTNNSEKRVRGRIKGTETTSIKKTKMSDTSTLSRDGLITELSELRRAPELDHIKPKRKRNLISKINLEEKKTDFNGISGNINDTLKLIEIQCIESKRNESIPYTNKTVENTKKIFGSSKNKNSTYKSVKIPVEENLVGSKNNNKTLRSKRSCNFLSSSVLSNSSFPINCEEGKRYNLRKNSRESNIFDNNFYFSGSVKVIFTGFECESLEKIIFDLGGKKTNDLSLGHVVVSDKIRRTVKFLCAIGLGLPITSPQWLLSSKKENKFLNPWNYILQENESEEKWNFNLKNSLEKSKRKKLLEGYSVFATENTKPPVKELMEIVQCCGGNPLYSRPDIWPKRTIIVSCPEDEKFWPLAKFRHIKIVHYEFILSGVLRQRADFQLYKLR